MQEKASRRFWVLFVLGFFAIDLTIAVIAISMAAGDPSFRSIPGFSERSVHWDARQQKQRTLESLGWRIVLETDRSTSHDLFLSVMNRDDQSVSDVVLKVTVFHYTRVASQQSVQCTARDGGHVANVKLDKPGLWHIDIEGTTADGQEIWTQQTIDWNVPK